MKVIGNILWFIFTGLIYGLIYFIAGLLLCVTIVGIPFGKQFFKMSKLMIFPFGKEIQSDFGAHPIANIIWVVFGGFAAAISFFAIGIVWCITILGIPFGKQCFKLGILTLMPFGATIK